jgi:hypothetical protein
MRQAPIGGDLRRVARRRPALGLCLAALGNPALAAVIAVLLAWAGRALAADFSSGGAFLALGHGARAHGLGGAGAALQRDDASVYWNPANLAWLARRNGVTLAHAVLIPEIHDGYETVSFARSQGRRLGAEDQALRPTRWGWGLFVSHLGFDFESGNGWSENVLVLGAAVAANNYMTLGIGLKALQLGNDFHEGGADGAGFDLGLSLLVLDRLTAAVVGRDVWTRVNWDTGKLETLDPSLTIGFEYRPFGRWAGEADFVFRQGAAQSTALGVEWQPFRDVLWLRGGLTFIAPGGSRAYPSTGAGVRFGRFVLDYGVSFDEEDALGVGQRVSLRAWL